MWSLLVRAPWWRRGASLAVLVVAVVASLAATLGPLYTRSAEQSYVLQHVADADRPPPTSS
jgi:hypothetical protein